MPQPGDRQQLERLRQRSHMPRGSLLFEKVIPIVLIVMAVLMVLLVLFAAGVLTGLVRF